ncbi:MAG: c-type cytochrome [Bacteroidota bacterium]
MISKIIHLGLTVAVVSFLLAACSGQVNGMPEPRPAAASRIETARRLMVSYGCGSCHTIPGVPGANASVGPPLDHFYERTSIAGQLSNTEDNLVRWIQNPQQVLPGDGMPNLGVTAEDARDIAAYLYHQPSWIELLTH